jgi:hypothetical protein
MARLSLSPPDCESRFEIVAGWHLDRLCHRGNIPLVTCEIEYTDEFGSWWDGLAEAEQESVASVVGMLAARGVALGFPYSSTVEASKFGHKRELRVQHGGEPYRIFYAFDPRRSAVLLIGGCKVGDDRFYERMVPIADRIYEDHLRGIDREGGSERK